MFTDVYCEIRNKSHIYNGKPPFSLPNWKVLTAQVSDTGRYVCVADNVAGSAEKSFNLNVHGECHVNVCNIMFIITFKTESE